MFMRSPNNVLFYSTHCIFNEVLFPKCATPVKKSLTRLLDAPPTHHYHKDTIQVPVDEDMPPRCHTKNKGKEHQQRAPMALEPPEESSSKEGSSSSEESSSCQECYKNSALFAQFLLTSLTYVLLSYFVRLHCANIHTPLPVLSYPYDFQNMKTRHSNLFSAKEDL